MVGIVSIGHPLLSEFLVMLMNRLLHLTQWLLGFVSALRPYVGSLTFPRLFFVSLGYNIVLLYYVEYGAV